MNLKLIDFPETQYIREEHPKSQIYLHHTAGNASGELTFRYWANNNERVATCVCISGMGRNAIDGQIVQGFHSRFWAYHLGLQKSTFDNLRLPYKSLDRISIGVEICNWGQLRLIDGKFYNYVDHEVPANEVITLAKPYKNHRFFHNYTDAQIESVRQLLVLWKSRYGINVNYNEDIWDICSRALRGEPGVYTHNSVRRDKIDIYPHPKIIQMLKSV